MTAPVFASLDSDADQLAPSRTWRTLFLELSLVLSGSLVGVAARAAIQLGVGPALNQWAGGWPLDLLLINGSGSALIGLFAGWRDEASRTHEQLWLALAIGFLGTYTTFSSLAGDLAQWTLHGQVVLGVGYLIGSIGVGLVAVEGGLAWGQHLAAQHRRPARPLPPVLQRIAVAYDGTSGSEQALALAITLATCSQAQIHLCSVAERIPRFATSPTTWDRRAGEQAQALTRRQEEARHHMLAAGLGVPICHVVVGLPREQLPALVTAVDAQLLIVGSHGRTQRAKRLVGSTAYRLFDRVACPVIVIG
ncbi:MAG: universal stress protein [Ktedonobacterales bacterium]|nr:universal stress protein [Ktedonobacterales bacterium]